MANTKAVTPEEIVAIAEGAGTIPDTAALEVVVEDKLVKVTPKEDLGRRWVGAGWLSLEKDKEITVTIDQKRVLREADAIYI